MSKKQALVVAALVAVAAAQSTDALARTVTIYNCTGNSHNFIVRSTDFTRTIEVDKRSSKMVNCQVGDDACRICLQRDTKSGQGCVDTMADATFTGTGVHQSHHHEGPPSGSECR